MNAMSLESAVLASFDKVGLPVTVFVGSYDPKTPTVIVEHKEYSTTFTLLDNEVRWGGPPYLHHDQASGSKVDEIVYLWARTSLALEELARILNKGSIVVGDGEYDDRSPLTPTQRTFLIAAGYVPGGQKGSMIPGYWTELLSKPVTAKMDGKLAELPKSMLSMSPK